MQIRRSGPCLNQRMAEKVNGDQVLYSMWPGQGWQRRKGGNSGRALDIQAMAPYVNRKPLLPGATTQN